MLLINKMIHLNIEIRISTVYLIINNDYSKVTVRFYSGIIKVLLFLCVTYSLYAVVQCRNPGI